MHFFYISVKYSRQQKLINKEKIMAIIKNLDYSEEEGGKKIKRGRKAKKSANNENPDVKSIDTSVSKSSKKKASGSFMSLVISVVVILVIVFGIFAYTNGKLSDLLEGDKESKELAQQVDVLKQEIETLRERSKELEQENEQNKEVVIDLFDKNRTLPKDVDTTDWLLYNNEQLDFQFSTPNYWEVSKVTVTPRENNPFEQPAAPVEEEKTNEAKKTEEKTEEAPKPVLPLYDQSVYLQPQADNNFILAVTIKNDYPDIVSLSLAEKYDIFKGLDLLDQRDFKDGKILYFIDLDKQNNEIPTILILTNSNIYRATFNVVDKTLDNYFKYRLDFEAFMTTFELRPATAAPAIETPAPTETPAS